MLTGAAGELERRGRLETARPFGLHRFAAIKVGHELSYHRNKGYQGSSSQCIIGRRSDDNVVR